MSRPIKVNNPQPRPWASRPRLNALSPLQTLSALSPESDVVKPRTPATSIASPGSITPSSLSRSGSVSSLSRSLSGRDLAFASRRPANSSDVSDTTSRLLLVKAPPSPNQSVHKPPQSGPGLASPGASASLPPKQVRKRSFAGASFGGFSPMAPLKRETSNPDLTTGNITPVGGQAGAGVTLLQNAPQLSPEQVMDLARGIMSPLAASEGTVTSGRHRRRKSTGSFKNAVGGGIILAEPDPIALEPVKYVEMDPDVQLPFHNRPVEVKELLDKPNNAQLVGLLQQTFPQGPMRPNWKDIDVHQWNWPEFYAHLTTIDRAECADYPWVELARDAVRQHSVALWENLGTCLGCDTELMMAGDEDETPASWGGLGLDEEGEYDPYQARVWIEGLESVDPETEAREFGEAFDDREVPSMATIGEERYIPTSEQSSDLYPARPRPLSYDFAMASSPSSTSSSASVSSPTLPMGRQKRAPSFVGLSITTSASTSAPRALNSYDEHDDQQQRTPGNPLFVSSFNTLSLGPTLGRKQSVSIGVPAADVDSFRGFQKPRAGVTRRASGTGLSESAVTFVSDFSMDGPFR